VEEGKFQSGKEAGKRDFRGGGRKKQQEEIKKDSL
jgi:hypothetical protein